MQHGNVNVKFGNWPCSTSIIFSFFLNYFSVMGGADIFRVVTYKRRTEISQLFFPVSLFFQLKKTQWNVNTLLIGWIPCIFSSINFLLHQFPPLSIFSSINFLLYQFPPLSISSSINFLLYQFSPLSISSSINFLLYQFPPL